jgi:3-oxoadipate enol-lactonase
VTEVTNEALHVETFGDKGPAVLFVHGIGGTGNVWGPQIGVLRNHFQLIVPDLPGCGRSATVEGITAEQFTETLIGVAEDRDLGQVHLVGHSFGSNLCQRVALARPDLIASVTIVGGGPGRGPRPDPHPLQVRADRVRAEGLLGVANDTIASATSKKTQTSRPVVTSFIRELVLGQDPVGYAAMCEAAATAPAFDSEKIGAPALLIAGTEDVVSPPAGARALHGQLSDATLSMIPEAGHWPSLERYRLVSQLLVQFLFQHS